MVTMNTDRQKSVRATEDTIVARATAPGKGAIAIIRISGQDAFKILAKVVKYKKNIQTVQERQINLVDVIDQDDQIIDQSMAVKYIEPDSYTGENVVELFVHGGPYIVSRIIDACCKAGARVARPGEFTLRAFLNGKLDLTQAEAIQDIISASSEASHKTALLQKQGNLAKRIAIIRDRLISVLALVELDIDFTEQETPLLDNDEIFKTLTDIEKILEDLSGTYERGRLSREGAVVVIGGPPNAGKSSLFNALIGEDKAITHHVPGTTRDAVEAVVEWGGWTVRLVDSAGITEEFTGVDLEAVNRSKRLVEGADLVLWVVDVSIKGKFVTPSWISSKLISVGNKVDLITEQRKDQSGFIFTSALDGTGLNQLKDIINDNIFGEYSTTRDNILLTSERHFSAVNDATGFVAAAKSILNTRNGIELVAFELREAVNKLKEITGEITNDLILEEIFSNFCLGK